MGIGRRSSTGRRLGWPASESGSHGLRRRSGPAARRRDFAPSGPAAPLPAVRAGPGESVTTRRGCGCRPAPVAKGRYFNVVFAPPIGLTLSTAGEGAREIGAEAGARGISARRTRHRLGWRYSRLGPSRHARRGPGVFRTRRRRVARVGATATAGSVAA